MVTPEELSELRRTVQEQVAKGQSKEQIRAAMQEAGYSDGDISLILSDKAKEQEDTTTEKKKGAIVISGENKKKKFVYLTGLVLTMLSILLLINPPMPPRLLMGNLYIFSIGMGLVGLLLYLYGGWSNPSGSFLSSKPVLLFITALLILAILWPIIQGKEISLYSPEGLCQNELYSTKESHGGSVVLKDSSIMKLTENIKNEGNRALEGLSDLTCLEVLDLSDAEVTDLAPLSGLPKLKTVILWNNELSEEECNELQNMLPNSEVDCWFIEPF